MAKDKELNKVEGSALFNDSCHIIDDAQKAAYYSVNVALIKRNWLLGMRINNDILDNKRADYGEAIISYLSKVLSVKYGKGYSKTNLYNYVSFYQTYPNFFQLPTGEFDIDKIFQLATGKSSVRLTWTHYSILTQVHDKEARQWYEREAFAETWSAKTLQRNISSQYYYRLLQSQHKDLVKKEMIEKTAPLEDKLEFIKNPVITEFLGLPSDPSFTESELESSIITNLQKFMMELGKGYAFVARQQHIHTEKEDYYIDLVFYNYILKCFVLIDLKTSKVTHQDVGQMDMYVRMYDELKRTQGDNPTIGILLCADTDEDIARYSILHDSDQIFAAKYKTYLPTEEELRAEIESQKRLYYLQHKK